MTLTDKLAALPPEPPAITEDGPYWNFRGYKFCTATGAFELRNAELVDALLARNALLCEALRAYGGHFDDCAGTAGFMDERCDCGLRAVLAACKVNL